MTSELTIPDMAERMLNSNSERPTTELKAISRERFGRSGADSEFAPLVRVQESKPDQRGADAPHTICPNPRVVPGLRPHAETLETETAAPSLPTPLFARW